MPTKTSQQNCDAINKLKLNTERLTITKFVEKDIKFNVAHEMNPQIMRFIRDPISKQEAIKRTTEIAKDFNGEERRWVLFAIYSKKSNSYAGMICFRYESIENNTIEIGWRLGLEYQNKGYATEAAKAVLNYLIKSLKPHKVVAYCINQHQASKNIMRKLAMQQEACLKQYAQLAGVWYDEAIFGRILDKNK